MAPARILLRQLHAHLASIGMEIGACKRQQLTAPQDSTGMVLLASRQLNQLPVRTILLARSKGALMREERGTV